MKKYYLLLFCNLWVFIIYAQSDFQFSQQSFMRIAFNPAVTGKILIITHCKLLVECSG